MSSSPPTDYELYLRVPELLSLQKQPSERACPDELLFQVVHQAAELWMKLVDHEMQQTGSLLAADRLAEAIKTLRRVHSVLALLGQSLETLYSLTPADYMRIREVLGRGSGQESPGFKRMMAVPGEVYPRFEALLDRRKLTLIELYRQPSLHADLFQVAEALVDYDLRLQEWRNRHILLVYRTIGVGTPSLKGKHSELLERGLRQQFFPKLWQVRDDLYGEWTAANPSGANYALSGTVQPDPHCPVVQAPARAPKPPKRKAK